MRKGLLETPKNQLYVARYRNDSWSVLEQVLAFDSPTKAYKLLKGGTPAGYSMFDFCTRDKDFTETSVGKFPFSKRASVVVLEAGRPALPTWREEREFLLETLTGFSLETTDGLDSVLMADVRGEHKPIVSGNIAFSDMIPVFNHHVQILSGRTLRPMRLATPLNILKWKRVTIEELRVLLVESDIQVRPQERGFADKLDAMFATKEDEP